MIGKRKTLLLIMSSVMMVSCFAVIIATRPSSASNSLAAKRSATVNSSITFTHFTNTDSIAQVTTTLNNGGTVRAYSTRMHSNYDAVVSSTNFLFFDYVNNGVSNDNITAEGSSRSMAPFQNITGVKVSMNGTGTLYFNKSSDGTSFTQTSITSSDVRVNVSDAKYFYFSASGGTRYLTSITLYYTCDPDGGDEPGGGDEPVGLTGSYTHALSQSKFIFDDNRHGHFTYNTKTVYFSYVVDGATFSITYESGPTDFGQYCIFPGGIDDPQTNTTGTLGTGWLQIQEYNESGGTTFSRTYNED
jgi:hypothetical protein